MTAPLHQAPDDDERVGAIVGTLAEVMASDPARFWGVTIGVVPERVQDFWRDTAEALAPTVARLMAQAAEEAVAERLAGVEAVARESISLIGAGGHGHWREGGAGGTCSACAAQNAARAAMTDLLSAALHPKETDR